MMQIMHKQQLCLVHRVCIRNGSRVSANVNRIHQLAHSILFSTSSSSQSQSQLSTSTTSTLSNIMRDNTLLSNNPKIGFIGCGNMASSLVRGLLSSKAMVPDDIIISDPDEKRRDEMSLLGRHYCK